MAECAALFRPTLTALRGSGCHPAKLSFIGWPKPSIDNDIDRVAEWFTEDFRLHDPKVPDWPTGHVGALRMLASVRAISPDLQAQILDMVEEADRVAVRWRFTGTRNGAPFRGSAIAIYRFEGGRIAEDWGMLTPADWP